MEPRLGYLLQRLYPSKLFWPQGFIVLRISIPAPIGSKASCQLCESVLLTQLILYLEKVGNKIARSESTSGKPFRVKRVRQQYAVYPRRAQKLERPGSASAF